MPKIPYMNLGMTYSGYGTLPPSSFCFKFSTMNFSGSMKNMGKKEACSRRKSDMKNIGKG